MAMLQLQLQLKFTIFTLISSCNVKMDMPSCKTGKSFGILNYHHLWDDGGFGPVVSEIKSAQQICSI